MFSLCELLRGREGHKLKREIQKIQRGPRSYFWSIHFFCADSSLLSLEAMFSFSPAWHVVKDRLHYALNSLESCTSTKELWRIAKWLCPAGSRLHTSTPTVAAAARTSNRKLQQITANFPDRWAADEWAQWDKLGVINVLFRQTPQNDARIWTYTCTEQLEKTGDGEVCIAVRKLHKIPLWNTWGIVSRLFGIVFVHMKVGF